MFLLIGWLEKRMRKPDHEEKQQPYFRYPRPDPYYGFFDNREKQMDMTAIELEHGQDPATVTNPAYWDCECEKDYIRPKSKFECDICNTCVDDQPDSRADEVAAALADVERWPSIETRDHYQIHGWVSMDTKIDVLASSREEAIKVAERVFDWRIRDMYNAAFGADERVYHDWYEPSCDDMEIVDVREYDGETCYTLESTAEGDA